MAAYSEFSTSRRFPALDGLRALSIVMVLTAHMHDQLWLGFNGALGVTLFFGISGFLITSLLLREKHRTGSVSLSGFYLRRIFRIVPLYALALLVVSVLVLGFGLGSGGGNFLARLPLLATFNGEFAGSGTFSHSWSLGIEEKFYIIWPIFAFFVPFVKSHLLQATIVLFPLTLLASFTPGVGYFGIYTAIVGGCLMAILMNSPHYFRFVFPLVRRVPATTAFVLLILYTLGGSQIIPIDDQSRYAHAFFSVLVVITLPGMVAGNGPLRWFFSRRPFVYYGQHAYGIYLFHPLVIELVDYVIRAGQNSTALALARFALVFVGSFAVAGILKRWFEDPLIKIGRSLTKSKLPVGSVSTDEVR